MSKELIKADATSNSLSFGDHSLDVKSKLEDFSFGGDLYKVKTFKEITKLEKNGLFVYESVPGSTVSDFATTAAGVTFGVEADADIQITLELEPETEYDVVIAGEDAGVMKTNLSGKMTISVDPDGKKADIAVSRK